MKKPEGQKSRACELSEVLEHCMNVKYPYSDYKWYADKIVVKIC